MNILVITKRSADQGRADPNWLPSFNVLFGPWRKWWRDAGRLSGARVTRSRALAWKMVFADKSDEAWLTSAITTSRGGSSDLVRLAAEVKADAVSIPVTATHDDRGDDRRPVDQPRISSRTRGFTSRRSCSPARRTSLLIDQGQPFQPSRSRTRAAHVVHPDQRWGGFQFAPKQEDRGPLKILPGGYSRC